MNKKGITFIELIVVLVIVAIGAALMAPNISAWMHTYRLRIAVRDIVSTLRVAQMKAVTKNIDHRVTFDSGEKSYVLMRHSGGVHWVVIGTDDQPAADLTDQRNKTQFLPKGIEISHISFSGNSAQFNPNSTSSAGSVTLKNSKGAEKTISLTPSTGRIRTD
jgi:prepilin-type N-terminal cleavage/methylation domain-containing protein